MDKMIYCQRDIPKEQWRYGLRSSAATGCGWIAAYNALRIMGYKPTAQMLIRYFEHQVPLFNGNTGTFILSPALFFKRFGFKVTTTASKKQFDKIAKQSDAGILYFWWKNGFKIGAHFVAVQYTPKGFVGYNTYKNSKGPDFYGESLEQFIARKKYFGAVFMGINDRK
ncbi:MAG: hypothetical protein IJW74_04070 [Oscillospiraceae bacterium]|nr:hypothetical protein [Oscillospiraceae bacterium]